MALYLFMLWGASALLIVVFVTMVNRYYRSYVRTGVTLRHKRHLLDVEERHFFHDLHKALSEDYLVFTKIRLLELSEFHADTKKLQRRFTYRELSTLCADFVVCNKTDFSIVGIIELERFDKTTKRRKKRETLLSSICKELSIQIFYFDSRQDYQSMDILRVVSGSHASKKLHAVVDPTLVSVANDSTSVPRSLDAIRKCPKCYAEVVTKIAVKGQYVGEKFLMCRKYPYCDYQISMKELSIKALQDKKAESRAKGGYDKW